MSVKQLGQIIISSEIASTKFRDLDRHLYHLHLLLIQVLSQSHRMTHTTSSDSDDSLLLSMSQSVVEKHAQDDANKCEALCSNPHSGNSCIPFRRSPFITQTKNTPKLKIAR